MTSRLQPWSGAEFAFMFLMWAVMMVAMMLPSATPMVLHYARVGRAAALDAKPFGPTGWFAAGYLLVWFGFAFAATGAQWALERAALLTPMASTSNVVGGILLIMAGLYQWSPLKDICLAHCQAPLLFIQSCGGFRRNVLGALEIGVLHGAYCVGCCWVLMTLLFVGGVMNVLWIAAIATLVLVEKTVGGHLVSRAVGAALIVGGWLLMLPMSAYRSFADFRANVCFGSLADIRERIRDVRFTPRSRHAHRRHQCLLRATSGRWRARLCYQCPCLTFGTCWRGRFSMRPRGGRHGRHFQV